MALTAKKRLFADAVLAGKSNKDAAIAAGYSVKTASAAGSRLVKDKDVGLYLAQHRKKGSAKAARPAGRSLDAEKVQVTEAAVEAGFDLATVLTFKDPKDFLLAAMNDQMTEPRLRVTAAQVLMPFMHQKLGEGGKKDAKAQAAEKAAGKFAALTAPKLVANGGKKV